ncbi:InlB B-repeat-containing protein [Cohnella sp. GCM10012308]|uniref:InlB B-repeat-containing protein n=1 Tax=Cohnella sp. GCM10012308 TaxID=3317329 RepID=UPI00361EC9AA
MIASSVDGVTWKANSSGVSSNIYGIAYGNNTFSAVGNNANLNFQNSAVVYNGNGYTGGTVPSDSNAYATGSSATVLAKGTMVKAGYAFTGWNTAADGSGSSYAAGATLSMDMDNVTLYAQWAAVPTYTVTYSGNGSTGGAVPTDGGAYENGQSVTVRGNTGSLVRAGYTFAGWNTAANGSGTARAAGSTFSMGSANVTLYAQWTLNPTYTVTYVGNGSTGGAVPTDSGAYENGQSVTVRGNTGSLVRSGYAFTGWNTAANGSGTARAAGSTFSMGSANVTLYAQWTLNPTYTLTYSGNGSTGGAVPTDGGAYENGQSVTVLGNTGSLVRTGYTFAGWNTAANGSGTARAAGSTFSMGTANVTLYAQWTPTYTVTYNANGSTGGAVPTDSGTYVNGASVTVLGNTGSLVKPGYTFAGWNTAANGSGTARAAGSTFSMGSANVTLYAQWTLNPTYTVTYSGNGSTGGTIPTDSGSYENGQSVTVLGNTGSLVRSGYTFAGWNTAANGSGTARAAGSTFSMGTANVTLYAQWTLNPTYTVTYVGNGSTGGAVPTDSGAYENGQSVTVRGNTGSLVRSGYAFTGWNTAANGSGTARAAGSTFSMATANVTLYAQWTPTYTVTYNANSSTGGTVPTDSGNYENGQSVTVLGNTGSLVRTGYTFAGWNTAANGSGTARAAGSTFSMGSANVTLYAQWTLNPTYTVTYSGNGSTGGSVPTDSGAYENGQSVTLRGNTGSLVRTGYTFAGWNTAANGSGTARAAGSTFSMGSANVTLYAQWTLNPTYTVTYSGNGSTGGSVPTDSGAYENGQSVTVRGNTGSLVRAGYTFAGWNTAANGSGTARAAGSTFSMGSANVTLYAQWTLNPTYTVTYSGNGSTGGAVPTDSGAYENGQSVTVRGNTGSLVRTGYAFTGWNTAANGSGTARAAGSTFNMGSANVTLYAQWTLNPTYTVTYNANGSTAGNLPTDSGAYEQSATVTVLGNTGNLEKAGYIFTGWNTAVNGSGTSYAPAATFTMGTASVTLYAQWQAIVTSSPPVKIVSTDGRLSLPAGGTGEVSFEDRVKVFIPSGATDKDVKITIARDREAENLLSTEKDPVSGVYEISKDIPDSFKSLVTISYAFDPSLLTEGQQPAMFYYDDIKKAWAEVSGGRVDGNWISIKANHLGEFVVLCVETVNGKSVPCGSAESPTTIDFSDISGHWAASNIQLAVSRGFVSGYPDGTFKPNRTVTRAEFAVMLANSLKLEVEGARLTFSDAAKIPSWAREAIAQAVKADIITGYEDGTFRPNATITRAEMASMIARALQLSPDANASTDFADDHLIPSWVKGAASAVQKLGIMEGSNANRFNPKAEATRAEAVTVLMRMLEKLGK